MAANKQRQKECHSEHQAEEWRGDYSKERHKIMDRLNIKDVIKTIRQMQKTK